MASIGERPIARTCITCGEESAKIKCCSRCHFACCCFKRVKLLGGPQKGDLYSNTRGHVDSYKVNLIFDLRSQITIERRKRPTFFSLPSRLSVACTPFFAKLPVTSINKTPKQRLHHVRLNEAVRMHPGSSILHRWLLRSQNALRPFPRLRSSSPTKLACFVIISMSNID